MYPIDDCVYDCYYVWLLHAVSDKVINPICEINVILIDLSQPR
jgi:hypothetical protein